MYLGSGILKLFYYLSDVFSIIDTLLETNISHAEDNFEDDWPFQFGGRCEFPRRGGLHGFIGSINIYSFK